MSEDIRANDTRKDEISVLDIDASGDVDPLTDGLLILRSMFGLTDNELVTGILSDQCSECSPLQIESYISSLETTNFGKLNSTVQTFEACLEIRQRVLSPSEVDF